MTAPSAPGYARYAREFYDSALAADHVVGTRDGYEIFAPAPVMYLVGHSIELILKSFLAHNGVNDNKLRKIGHDLEKCYKKAKQLGLNSVVTLNAENEEVLEVLNVLYKTKQLNYLVTGSKKFPIMGPLQNLTVKLLDAIGPEVGFR